MVLRTKRCWMVAAVAAVVAAQGCGSSGPQPAPSNVPSVQKIVVPPDFTTEEAVAVPAALSGDGKVAVGTIFVRRAGLFVPISAFRWTASGGTQILEAPGYLVTMAVATSGDGSVLAGNAMDGDGPSPASWVWTAAQGFRIIPLPDGATSSLVQDVTADGAMVVGSFVTPDGNDDAVRDLFVWSHAGGFAALSIGGADKQVIPAAMSDDGLRIAYNCLDVVAGACSPQGTTTLQNATRDWAPSTFDVYPPTITQERDAWCATDLSSDEFGTYSNHSSDLLVVGGFAVASFEDYPLAHPALWMAATGQVDVLAALGWNGHVSAVSPSGTLAGFDRHYAAGTPYAHVWSMASGVTDLLLLMERADANLGSKLLDAFPFHTGIPGWLTGFSSDDTRAAGVTFSYEGSADLMFGYVIDGIDRMVE